MLLATERRGRFFMASASIALALIATLAVAARAQSAEFLYWDNYTSPASVGFANGDGSGGGTLNLTGSTDFKSPEGMAYDTVTNKLFVPNEGGANGQITVIDLGGGGATSFSAPGAPIEEPEGIAVDPVSRTLYWINTKSETLAWARIDGSAGGVLSTGGTELNSSYRLALDPVGGRLYWGNQTGSNEYEIGFANTNNTGGGTLDISGATAPEAVTGLSVDPAAGRVYWLDNSGGRISFAGLGGGGGGDIDPAGAPFLEPYGLALDPSQGKLYWANYSNSDDLAADQFGFALLSGGRGGITIQTAATNGVQDPLVIKSPEATAASALVRNAKNRTALSCTPGAWGADFAGSFVYRAPRTTGLQWTRNGAAIPGATAATFTATKPGSYACVETATNQAGSTAQTSAAATVKAAKLKLSTKKKAKAEAGDLVKFKVKAVNQGDLKPKNAKLCVKLPKAAKDDLKAPKCKKIGIAGRGKKTLTIKVKVKGGADQGTDKLTFQVKGAAGKAAKSKILVG